jgi:DNA-binding transcriptional MerR regulator
MNIGELARRTGLTVKTIRYYSDEGLVPEVSRTASGYRRYDQAALVRLEFVRTLRDLGLDLATIRRVLDRQVDLRAVARAHAEALAAQIRLLRVQRAALRALAEGEPTPEEVDRMNRIVQATAEERRRLLDDFLNSIFDLGDGPIDNEFTRNLRGATPELPDDPTDAQLDAWLELAELLRDEEFRTRLREMSRRSFGPAADEAQVMPNGPEARELADKVAARVQEATDAGVAPGSAGAGPVLDDLVALCAAAAGRTDTPEYRAELLPALELAYEPRAERYWQLLAVINGWPAFPPQMHLWGWFVHALRASQTG